MSANQIAEAFIAPDEIVADETLVDSAALARQTGLPLDGSRTPRGEDAVRWEPGQQPTIRLTVRSDWGEFDQIVVPLHVPADQGGTLHVSVEMTTQTPGLEGNDRYFTRYPVGAAARRGWHGWRELEYGIENFLILGIPDGWHAVTTLTLSLPEPDQPDWALLGPIRLQQRRRPAGPRLTDAGLFAQLDLDYPGLETVRAAARASDWPAARRALAGYFRRRERPRSIYPLPMTEPADLAAADAIRDHIILDQALGREIDWKVNPIGYLEWMHAFNRHGFMQRLVAAYQETDDEKYAAELDYLVSSWIRATPSPVGNDGGGDPAWETLSVAVRCYAAWFNIFYACRQSPYLRDETIIDMVKSFYHHAEHLMEYGVTRHNNWLVVESQVIASLGILFPEFRRAADWRREGVQRLTDEIAIQVYPDGAQWELSAGYHMMCGQGFASVYELAALNGIMLPPIYTERLRAMFDYIWRLARPDGSLPSHNDSGSAVDHSPITSQARQKARGRSASSSGAGQAFVARGVRLFDDPTMAWFATDGESGAPPTIASHGFVDAGLLVTRSGWEPEARWALFDAGPYGAAHQHEDALGLEVWADGALFLCDPGISSYMLERWTEHQRDTSSHNTILLDGCPQARRTNERRAQQVRSAREEIFWATSAVADVARARYAAGYRDLPGRFTHERAVVFVRPDYWLVFDEVRDEDSGADRHLVESLFHFMPMRMQIDRVAGRVRTYRQNKPNLELILLNQGRGPALDIVCGQHDPVQGWVSINRENIPAPCVILRQRTRLPFRQGLALYPYASSVSAGVTTRRLRASGSTLAYELRHADGRGDLIAYRWGGSKDLRAGGYATDGWLMLIRHAADGRVLSAIAAGATGLDHDGRALARDGVIVELLTG